MPNPETPNTRGRLGRPDLAYSLSANRWAVIVGISSYKEPTWNLKYARRDAEELYALLQLPQSGARGRLSADARYGPAGHRRHGAADARNHAVHEGKPGSKTSDPAGGYVSQRDHWGHARRQ